MKNTFDVVNMKIQKMLYVSIRHQSPTRTAQNPQRTFSISLPSELSICPTATRENVGFELLTRGVIAFLISFAQCVSAN